MKKIIRACVCVDASLKAGLGHVKRQEILGKKLQERGILLTYISRSSGDFFSGLPGKFISVKNYNDFFLATRGCDLIIVDEPEPEVSWFLEAKPKFLVGIDELGPLRNFLDLHICTTLLGVESGFEIHGKTHEYRGIEWFILDSRQNRQEKDPKTVLVSFGGTDPQNITTLFLKNLPKKMNLDLKIVLGPGFCEVQKTWILENLPPKNLLLTPRSLIPFLNSSRFVISSGGITLFEAISSKAIALVIAQTKEQAEVASRLHQKNFCFFFGMFDEINWKDFFSILSSLVQSKNFTDEFQKISDTIQSLDFSQGAQKSTDLILNYLSKSMYPTKKKGTGT